MFSWINLFVLCTVNSTHIVGGEEENVDTTPVMTHMKSGSTHSTASWVTDPNEWNNSAYCKM